MMSPIAMNQDTVERFVRIFVGGFFLALACYAPINMVLAWGSALLAMILMLTGLAGYCPINALVKKAPAS